MVRLGFNFLTYPITHLHTFGPVKKILYILEEKEFDVLENARNRVIEAFARFQQFCKEDPRALKIISSLERGYDLFFLPYDRAVANLEERGYISRP